MFATLRAVFGRGRHRLTTHRTREVIPELLTLTMVDAGTLRAHRLSIDAERRDGAAGPYIALCGADVTPAAMVEPGQSDCGSCIPTREIR